jgi:potassium-transporting ATPase KdpC subunit
MATRLPAWIRQHLAAVRAVLVFTILLGLAYPLAVTAIAQLPGLKHKADGSLLDSPQGTVIGSVLIGQSFVDKDGTPLPAYFQSRPSAAGAGYDPTATAASNLGPESVVDTDDKPSLLTGVCARSKAIGALEKVDGRRPYCTASGVGAALAVFHTGPGYAGPVIRVVSVNERCGTVTATFIPTYEGQDVECHRPGDDVTAGQLVVIRGDAPATPAVPADAVTTSASGLDPDISPAYADLQAPRIAAARPLPLDRVRQLIRAHTTARALGFIGDPAVDVLELNLDLDRLAPTTH